VYTKNGVFGYVILLPLVNRGNFNVYRLIPIPVSLDRTKFLYVFTGKSFLWIDQARLYYIMMDEGWKDSCKVLNNMQYVCKKNQPLLSSHLHENCMVKLLQPSGAFPPFVRNEYLRFQIQFGPIWSTMNGFISSPRVRVL